jgi:hypothetical protein
MIHTLKHLKVHNEWILTDPSCNQMRKTVVEGKIYLFKEDRIINPKTKETNTYESEMNISDYNKHEIISACKSFGYSDIQIDKWISEGKEIELILECLFELES